MAIDFPSNPSDGQTKTYKGKTWTYDSSTTSWIFTPSTFTETDPIVGAINGLVKAGGDGSISAAIAGTDYLSSTDDIDTRLKVLPTNPSDGHVLSWNSTSGDYVWVAQSSGGTNYTDSDVNTHLNVSPTKPTDGYVLSWDATADSGNGDYAWVAQSSGGGSSSTTWTLNADGASSDYIFSGPGIETGNTNDPELFLVRGQTYIFSNQSGSHPFQIQSTSGAGGTSYSTGVTNNNTVGDVIFTVPMDAPDTLYYQCTSHSSMGGTINISGYTNSDVNTLLKNTGSITDGHVLSWDATAGDYAWVAQSSGGGSSLWSENSSELYRNSKVGIGDFSSTAPSSKLHVQAVSNEPALNCGNNNTSSGPYSTAIGVSCESTSVYSISMGYNANAWSKFSIAIGNEDTATSTSSSANTLGEYSIAIGNWAITKANRSLAFGNEVTSGGSKSTAMGHKMASLGSYSFGIGLANTNYSVSQSSTMAIMGGKVAIDTSTTLVNSVYTLDDITEKLEVGGAIKIGTTSTALPTGGEIKYDSNDFFGHNGTEWKSLTSGGGGGGTLSSRTTFNTNTDMTTADSKTLTVGASASGYITGFKSYSLLKINISQPDLWVTIYTDPNSMSSDANRLYTQDPNPSSGVIAEFITDSNNSAQDIIITPTVIGFNAESTPADKIYLKVSNIGSSNQTSDFTIQMTVLQLEA